MHIHVLKTKLNIIVSCAIVGTPNGKHIELTILTLISFGYYLFDFYIQDNKHQQLEENGSDLIFEAKVFYYSSFKLLDQLN